MKRSGLTVALSGGSIRGVAHIGFLEVLDKHNIPVNRIVGTSMGALVGGLYAAGKLKELKEELLKLSKNKILALLLSDRIKKGKSSTKEIEKILEPMIKGVQTEKLPIRFTAIATNLKTGGEIYLEKGSLLRNISASTSIPGIFQPVKIKNMLLVDGGVTDPLPEEYARKKSRKVIAVNAMPAKINYKKNGNTFDIISEAMGILSNKLINLNEFKNKEELFVQIKTRGIDSFDFKSIDKVIELGRKAGEKHIKRIIEIANS